MTNEFKTYTIKKGDNLSNISTEFYGSPNFVDKIVEYNSLKNSNSIFINQQIILPGIEELKPFPYPNPVDRVIPVPNGLHEIISTFGDIRKYITRTGELSPSWNVEQLTSVTLPFPIKYANNFRQNIIQITCHKKLNKTFYNVFNEILQKNLTNEIKSYGGCFNFRTKRNGSSFSTHSWGIAIDLNPLSNGMGSKGDMSPKIVEIFREHGFKWGGDWIGKGCDPMHFQYCTGY